MFPNVGSTFLPGFVRIVWSPDSGTSRVSRRQLARIRVAAFERRILSQASWSHFSIWGAGRDSHVFFSELSKKAQSKVVAFVDLDSGKCGTAYTNHHCCTDNHTDRSLQGVSQNIFARRELH